jgi:hypothetical protein
MIEARQLTFGVEIETVAPDHLVRQEGGLRLRIGPRHRGIQVPYLPAGWKAEHDCSIGADHGGHSCEIVSPILQGPEGLAAVIQALQVLKDNGHSVNASCGVHVHVGWPRQLPADALARLVTMVAYVEKGLYAITGTKNRERGTYCRGVRRYNDRANARDQIERVRYHVLNLTNLAHGTKRTIEFRVFSGSLNPTKVVGWVQVCLGLVERALNGKRTPVWHPKPPSGGWKKAGEGQSEVERLLGFLAWGPGYARIHGGRQYGWMLDAETQDAVKAEFRRLARKYDEQT